VSPDIRPIIDRVLSQAGSGRPWSVSASEVASLLGIEDAELCRRIYAASLEPRAILDLSAATGTFGPESVPELLAVLELFYGRSAERDLEHAGLFFSHERRVDMLEAFVSVASRLVTAHVVDEPKYSAMLRTFGGYEAARDVYLAELPSVEDILAQAVDAFCRGRSFGIPELARDTVAATLRTFLRRKVLSIDDVLAPLLLRLRAQAEREGFVQARRRPGRLDGEAPGASTMDAARAERTRALRAMEMQGQKVTADVLRSRYRSLMKRYHPDVNPKGLERAKEINAAYALLVAALAVDPSPAAQG
jgi:hypothetical protein